jgi:hypothetical protein
MYTFLREKYGLPLEYDISNIILDRVQYILSTTIYYVLPRFCNNLYS